MPLNPAPPFFTRVEKIKSVGEEINLGRLQKAMA